MYNISNHESMEFIWKNKEYEDIVDSSSDPNRKIAFSFQDRLSQARSFTSRALNE